MQLQPVNGVIPTNVYTAILLFAFDNTSGWRRILDVKNPVSDYGLYELSGNLDFYPVVGGSGSPMSASNYVQVVITRDAASNVVCYANGIQQLAFVDTQNYSVISGSPLQLRFFKDNTSEDASGAVARIRLYDKVMPAAQVSALDRLPGGIARPVFGRPYVSGGILYLPATVTPGYSYRLLGSTNLVSWVSISTNNIGTTSFTFTDPLGPAYPERFYRLVTP